MEKKEVMVGFRLKPEQHALLVEAARIDYRCKSQFVRSAALRRAQEVLNESEH